MASIKVKTPTKSWEAKQGVIYNDVITKEVKSRVANIVLGELSASARIAIEREISILATFFQRVVARTPIDESYEITLVDKKGNERKKVHKIDRSVCQDSWYITDGNVKITAKQMKAIDDRMFWNVNDNYMVNQIKKIIKEKFKVTSKTNFVVGNDNDHFKRLEEGYSKWFNDHVAATKSVAGLYRDHGVKNMHSIQAPVGMWRISLAELEVMKNSNVKSPLTSRYRAQPWRTMNKMPNKTKLAEFARLLEKKGNISYKDIVRYIEEY